MTDDRTRFGKYELVELLGEGGMASVYRAMLSGPGGFRKQVAVKQIRPHIGKDEKMVQLMFNEARLGGHLRHKNIVEVYEFDQVEDTYYLAIEFVDGFTLSDLLRQGGDRGPIPPRIVANLAMQICQALAYAHGATDEQGKPMRLVHRDLKPANVMVRRDGLVKLADFGIAKAETNVTHTTTGLTRGTPAYMSPEQVTGGRSAPLDHRSDLFSLASIVTELLTGERAFADEQMLDLMNRIASVDVADPLERIARCASPFVPVLKTAFQRMPVDRHDDAAAMGKDIRRIYDRLPASEERVSVWLVDRMEDEGTDSLGPDTPTALVGDDALVNPTPSAVESLSFPPTRPSTAVQAAAMGRGIPDDARDTLETHVEAIHTPQPGEDWPVVPGGPPATDAFFATGEGQAPELDSEAERGVAGGEAEPEEASSPAPRSARRRRRRPSRGDPLPVMLLLAAAVLAAIPILVWKLDLLGGPADEAGPADPIDAGQSADAEAAAAWDEEWALWEGRPESSGQPTGRGGATPPRTVEPVEEGSGPVVAIHPEEEEPDGSGGDIPEGRDTRVDAALSALASKAKIRGCYRRHRARMGDFPPITVTFVVAPGGALSEARVIRPDDLNADLAACLVTAVDGSKLMRAATDEPVKRSYTFSGQ